MKDTIVLLIVNDSVDRIVLSTDSFNSSSDKIYFIDLYFTTVACFNSLVTTPGIITPSPSMSSNLISSARNSVGFTVGRRIPLTFMLGVLYETTFPISAFSDM